MAIIVNSPFSGKPVKVREQDVGRSVRDEEGRVFYVLQRADGEGYYSSPTRQGGQKDQDRYDQMASKQAGAAVNMQKETAALHDATGKPRSSARGKIVILFFVIVVIALAWYARDFLYNKWIKPPEPGTMPVSRIAPTHESVALLTPAGQSVTPIRSLASL